MTMDAVQIFSDELQSLLDTKPPVSKAKMGLITRAAMKGVKFYKHIVLSVERFIANCSSEYKVPGLYVIDSIVRQSRHQFGIDRDVYAVRFSRNLSLTFENLFTRCSLDDKAKIVRVLNLWQKNGVFNSQIIQPLMSMAENAGSNFAERNLPATSPPIENNSKSGQSSSYHYESSSSGLHQETNESGLKFSKNMLDFDYGEEDDDNGDETPTEAEPPLSSTLNKIEMEQRGHQRNSVSNNINYQSSHEAPHQKAPYQHPDPVLERWNRIIRGEISNDDRSRRSRSRSPEHSSYSSRTVASKPADFVYKPPTQIEVVRQPSAKEAERAAEREKKCLPKIRDKHLTVCSSTLWLGHVPKAISEADLSNAFGEYGTITSIDLIPPRGCAYICMDRRQDAKRALNESKDLKLNGSHIKMAWAPGKGFKEYKKLKDFWEVESGSSFIPYSRVDESIDFETLEEGGVIDEDSMSMEMSERRARRQKEKEQQQAQRENLQALNSNLPIPALPLMNQPPPPPPTSIAPFNMPMPHHLGIPPPSALSQGMLLFPPPSVPIVTSAASSSSHVNPSPAITNDNSKDIDAEDSSPSNIDQQLSMTERQISMVEQQLNMIKQAQNMNVTHHVTQQNNIPQMPPAPIFHPQNQPNPMMFDIPTQPGLVPGGPPLLNPGIFVNPSQLLHQPPPMLPISQANMMDPANLHNSMMPYHQGRF